MPPDAPRCHGTGMDGVGYKDKKNPVNTGLIGSSWKMLDLSLVEAAGIEPVFRIPIKTTTYNAVSTCLSPRM